MMRAFTWFIRVCCVLILWAVWALLPYMMPGAGALKRAVWFICMVAAFNLSVIALMATLIPLRRTANTRQHKADMESMRRHVAGITEHKQKGGSSEGI